MSVPLRSFDAPGLTLGPELGGPTFYGLINETSKLDYRKLGRLSEARLRYRWISHAYLPTTRHSGRPEIIPLGTDSSLGPLNHGSDGIASSDNCRPT